MNDNHVNLSALDLNLITALDALLGLRSVSDAANAVGRTQSAMSHSLARLRDHFHDPIMIRDGWGMRLTPFAEQLRPRVSEAARSARQLFEVETAFDPATTDKRIRIAAPDLCASLFTPFIGDVSRAAPAASVAFIPGTAARQAVLNADVDIGLGFGRPKTDPNLVIVSITPLAWCTFAPRDHPYAHAPSKEGWAKAAHVVVSQKDTAAGPVEKAAQKQGLTRHVGCYASSFSAALNLAAANDALFTTLRAPFENTAQQLGLQACPTPFPMPDAPASLMFRADYGDRFSVWLRELCCASVL